MQDNVMVLTLILLIELTALYLVSQALTQAVYDLTILIFRARSVGITVVSLLTFPGTVIHELSHLFTAEVLGVRTGKLTLVPENIQEEEVRAGSVMIAESDPFRRYVIGLAPIFTGLVVLMALAYVWAQIPGWEVWGAMGNWWYIVIGYLQFTVSSAMFSSNEDLKGFIPFAIALFAMIAAGYVAGLRIGLTGALLTVVIKILDALVKSLGVVLAINLIGLLITKILMLLTQKLTHRKLMHR